MGIFDIFVGIIALVALVNGWRKGLIAQVCSIVAIVAGIWLSASFGETVGSMLSVDAQYAKPAGFMIVFAAVLIVLALLSRVVMKIFSFVGLGVVNSALGAVLSVAKYALILGFLCSAFNNFNGNGRIIDKSKLDGTIFFRPLCRAADVIDLFDVQQAEKFLEDKTEKLLENNVEKLLEEKVKQVVEEAKI